MKEILKGFWVLEGLDGAGTTTQLGKLKEEFQRQGKKCFTTCEPTKNETGLFLRRILSGEIPLSQSSIARMFATDRDDHINNPDYGIRKYLSEGYTVISDRYLFSSLAYQSIGYDYSAIEKINSDFPFPEHIIFIDTPPEVCLNRINNRGQAKEIYEKLDFQIKVRENYIRCFNGIPKECKIHIVDGTKNIDEIFGILKFQLF